MSSRKVEDLLREEYLDLLPELVRLADDLKARIEFHILPVARQLKTYENLIVKARIKDCSSAIDALKRRSQARLFDQEHPDLYSLKALRDLVGIRVLAFPSEQAAQVDTLLRDEFPEWTSDPVIDSQTGQQLASKYYGVDPHSPSALLCEYQIASTLTGLFWEVEHAAIYKSAPNLKAFINSPAMRERTSDVYSALKAFEGEFERQLKQADRSGKSVVSA
ncbi:nucleotidyltransferase family protein [Granulicella tundricola]|uniref:Uncharacterized protein n=1 Tax=Granulicella tundricola (strain ATCC BAA-1859 / DSM 23138 / MP5ACTX9) TaxID=1198114 RepID=E8X548_GRATM|nr:hypothetical protein [Granulicella tundricola]ADW68312.1 hypothetical protein AciX9_1250 [Granulicella tundricola MP5ACTX9]